MAEPKTWKLRVWEDPVYRDYYKEPEYFRDGIVGRNCQMGDVHECREHNLHNGSGPNSFGGAKDWPCVTLRIAFAEGQEAKRDELSLLLRNVTSEFLEGMGA